MQPLVGDDSLAARIFATHPGQAVIHFGPLKKDLGTAYIEYCRRTKRLVTFLY